MAELKDFGVVKSWYEAYKQVNEKKEPEVKVLPDDDEEKEKKPEPKATDDADSLKAENEKLKAEVEKLKLDVAKKDAETNVEPNAETGEVPLRVGIAQSILDKKKKAEKKEVKEETLDEKLKVSDGLGAWISDFQKSDAPQFKGKSDKERRDMAIAAFTDAGGKLESVDEAKNLNDLKKMLDNTTLLTPKEKKDIQSLEKKMGAKAYTKVLNKMFSEETEQLEEANAVEYARKLSSYAVKKGGIDKKDFMKIADRMSNAKNDNDMKKIGDMIDSLDTEPRDLVQGSIALLMGPKTYLKMFGDRLTSRDMNQYKKMTPRDMKEESLDELKEPFIVVDTAQGNKVVGMASDEKEAQSIISSSERPPMRIKNKKTLKVVKVRKKQMIGRPLKEESLDEVNADAKGTITSKQMNALKKSYNSLPDRIDPEKAMALAKMLDRFGEGELRQLTHAGIKFISTLAINKLIMKHKYKAKDIHDIRKNKPKTVFEHTDNLDEGYIDRLNDLMKKHNIKHDGIDTSGKLRVKKDQVNKAQDIIKKTKELIQKPKVISRGY